MSSAFEYILPAVLIKDDFQGDLKFYNILLPFKILLKLLNTNLQQTIPAELVARRALEEASIENIQDVDVLQNLLTRINNITVVVNTNVIFDRSDSGMGFQNQGLLRIPMETDFTVINGMQTISILKSAISKKTELLETTVTLNLLPDPSCAILQGKPITSNSYDNYSIEDSQNSFRERMSLIARAVTQTVKPFRILTDFERSSLPIRSKYLFTFSSIRTATIALLKNYEKDVLKQTSFAIEYWLAISQYMTEWAEVLSREVTAGEIRQNYVHSYAPTLSGFGYLGAALLEQYPLDWSEHLLKLSRINWKRSNPDWIGRIIIDGRVSKTRESVMLMSSYLKKNLDLVLTSEEEALESRLRLSN